MVHNRCDQTDRHAPINRGNCRTTSFCVVWFAIRISSLINVQAVRAPPGRGLTLTRHLADGDV